MPRVITSVTFDLKFNVLQTAPAIHVEFTDRDDDETETEGRTRFNDAAALSIFEVGMLDRLNAAIDKQATEYAEPGKVTERITAASAAERRQREAEATKLSVDTQIAAATAELAEKMAAIALADKALADLSARDDV